MGTKFQRVMKGFMAQGGDNQHGIGGHGESVWGGAFADESFALVTAAGLEPRGARPPAPLAPYCSLLLLHSLLTAPYNFLRLLTAPYDILRLLTAPAPVARRARCPLDGERGREYES